MTSSMLTARQADKRVFDETVSVLGGFRPGYPKFYSIAGLGEHSRRRWVPLERAVEGGRVERMFRDYFTESGDIRFATYLVADAFAHAVLGRAVDRKSTRLNSSHVSISYAVFCLKTPKDK